MCTQLLYCGHMGRELGIRELRDALSETIAAVQRGEVITVTRHGVPVARVVPVRAAAGLERLVADGRLSWSGARLSPRGRPAPLRGSGPSAADAVREGRR